MSRRLHTECGKGSRPETTDGDTSTKTTSRKRVERWTVGVGRPNESTDKRDPCSRTSVSTSKEDPRVTRHF